MAKACASHGSRNTGPSASHGMLGTASVARRAATGSISEPSFRPSERSERAPESITTNLSGKRRRQIDPAGILTLDQFDFPVPTPFLQLLFSRALRWDRRTLQNKRACLCRT